MEFVEAVNPHYAFPIVGVIVCCLLVFAFGFKSPGQPPSFDIVDEERKVVKKRKGKENQKSKLQQNGRVTSAVPAKVEADVHNTQKLKVESVPHSSPKKKVESGPHNTAKTKVASSERQSSKPETKPPGRKGRLQATAKQAEPGKKSAVVKSEDGNEDGWVQLISKKERKNRKKDDVVSYVTDIIKPVPAVVEVEPVAPEIPPKSVGLFNNEVIPQTEKVNDVSESDADKESPDLKSTSKVQKIPKKKKGKKEDVEISVDTTELPSSVVIEAPKEKSISSESKSYAQISNSNTVLEPPSDDLLQVREVADGSEEDLKSKAKKKKNKKKNQEETADNAKTDTTNVNAKEDQSEVKEQLVIPKSEVIIESKLPAVELEDNADKKVELKEPQPVSTPGSNVAFDELGDMSADDKKTQKKKKKVRREH